MAEADKKTAAALARESNIDKGPNTWERNPARFTEDSTTSKRLSSNSDPVNYAVRANQGKNPGQNRSSIITEGGSGESALNLSDYEKAILKSTMVGDGELTVQKFKSYNACSKSFAASPIWETGPGETQEEEYRRAVNSSFQTVLYIDPEGKNLEPGVLIEQAYTDASQTVATLLEINKARGIIEGLDDLISPKAGWTQYLQDLFDNIPFPNSSVLPNASTPSGKPTTSIAAPLSSKCGISPRANEIGTWIFNRIMKRRDPLLHLYGNCSPPGIRTDCSQGGWRGRYRAKSSQVAKNTVNRQKSRGNLSNLTSSEAIDTVSKKLGLNRDMMYKIARMESAGNMNRVSTSQTRATGLYQILPGRIARSYGEGIGIAGAEFDTDKYLKDAYWSALAVGTRLKNNQSELAPLLGRPLEPWEVYVTHHDGPHSFYIEQVAAHVYQKMHKMGGQEAMVHATQLIMNQGFGPIFLGGRWRQSTTTKSAVFPRPHLALLKTLSKADLLIAPCPSS